MPPTFSYIQCQFSGMRFVVRIESRLVPAAIRGSARELMVTPTPTFCADLPASSFAAIEGNKLYKLAYYLQHFREHEAVSKIWSYGSVQSGAMLALSELAQLMGVEFHYVLPYIASELALHPEGNLALAKGKQMHLHVDGALYKRMARGEFVPAPGELFFHEGGNHAQVAYGMTVLGEELGQVAESLKFNKVFLPAGTGVTAYHLAQANPQLTHYTTPAYGDAAHLQQVFSRLGSSTSEPAILTSETHYRFGSLYRELWLLQAELQAATGIAFDLLYDMAGWMAILDQREQLGQDWLYLHQGGLGGSVTLAERYRKQFGAEDVKAELSLSAA